MAPEFGYSNMRPCLPGMGFQVNAYTDLTFSYPEPLDDAAFVHEMNEPCGCWRAPLPTGADMSVLVTSVADPNVSDGDQIGAFNAKTGDLVGVGMVQGGVCGLAVWGDDVATDKVDGMLTGECFILKLWDADRMREMELEASIYHRGSDLFWVKDGFVVLDAIPAETAPLEFTLSGVYPNPFNAATQLTFTLPEDAKVRLSVCDIAGRTVDVMIDKHMAAGRHACTWNAGDLPSGIYIFTLEAGGRRLHTRGILMK
jgi:hypothetical protein